MTQNLTEKAMLVRLSISTWSATKHDKKITAEVAQLHGASQSAGRYNKALVDRTCLNEIRQKASEFRHWHYLQTLPWDDESYRILPSKNYFPYTEHARKLETKLRDAMSAFCAEYPRFRQEAKQALNGLFDEADYPSDTRIADKFGVDVKFKPMPSGADFRVAIGDEEANEIRAQIEKSTRDAVAFGMKDVWQRVYDAVAHMVDRLNAYGKDPNGKVVGAFRDSLVSNLTDICEVLPRLNLTEDIALDNMTAEIRKTLIVAPDILRESEATRKQTAKAAEDILARMKEFVA